LTQNNKKLLAFYLGTSRLGFVVLFLLAQLSYGQEPYLVKKITEKIILDGQLNEDIWQKSKSIGHFWQYFPNDSSLAKYDTEIFLAYDDRNIYVASKAYAKGNNYVVPSLRRDFRAGGNDNITFMFDTFHDNNNAFAFGTNPLGVAREALVFNGGVDNSFMNLFWDNKWACAAKTYDGYFINEAAIPFTTLRFNENNKTWNFKAYRFDTQGNETSVLNRMPQSILIMSLGYSTPIQFEQPLKKAKGNLALIPYMSANSAKDYINGSQSNKVNFGADAKLAVTTGLNLDLTVNPDFSTVEADRQQVNLSRFDITLPEQRQFFMENSDLFTGFGSYNTNPFLPPGTNVVAVGNQVFTPFFSRKIGIALDSTTGTNVQTPIVFGARLSGKIDDNWRIGLMNTLTGSDATKGIKRTNFTVAALSRRVFGRSNIAAIWVNKSTANHTLTDTGLAYSGVAGLEYNLQSLNNKWQGKAFYHKAVNPMAGPGKEAHGLNLNYTTNKLIVKWAHEWLGQNFVSEAGFIPRNHFLHIAPTVGFNFFPKNSKLQRLSVGLAYDSYQKPGLGLTDRQAGPFMLTSFHNQIRVLQQLNQNYTYLFNDFDALRANGRLPILKKGSQYRYLNYTATITSDLRKRLTLVAVPIVGQYLNGSIASLRGELGYRVQPYAVLSLNVNYNDIRLAEGNNKVTILGPKTDITFSRNLFWTTYLQYNSQFENLNINSRLQWRFAPVSDLFLVYSDNYGSATGLHKNRAIIAKATYWFNM
jgi:hypothetical protein